MSLSIAATTANSMRIAIRADASRLIGTGHIMRCVVIADRLYREFHAEILFVMREHAGHLIDFVVQKGFSVAVLPLGSACNEVRAPYDQWLGASEQEDIDHTKLALAEFNPDWILFDHYALGELSHHAVKNAFSCAVAVIDDLADRPLNCDVLIDHNCALDHPGRYKAYVPAQAKCFFGPCFTPFRDELLFSAQHPLEQSASDDKKRIFVFLGGGDVYAATILVLNGLFSIKKLESVNIDVVIGMSCPNKEKIEAACATQENIRFFCQTPQLGELMLNADLAIGTGGINSSERCLLRLPAITFALAENQKPGLTSYAALGCVTHLGDFSDITEHDIAKAVNELLFSEEKLNAMKKACADVIPLPTQQDGLSEICNYIGSNVKSIKDCQHENR